MKFHVRQIILWFRNNAEPQTFDFLPNKVNVITGASGTGKTSILSIIDYCLLSTKANITEEIINENVSWYGLVFSINDKDLVIIRKHPINNWGAKEIYFSADGSIPKEPKENNDIKYVKSALEREFGIDENLKIPYGGKLIAAGSKISYRYFLLFNTLSEDTIAHTSIFFDYHLHDKEKYMEALERIFFLAIGVDDVKNVLAKEKIESLEKEISKIEKKKKLLSKEERLFNTEILNLLHKAQEYDLIERKLFSIEEGYQRLLMLINQFITANYSNNMQRVDELNKQKRILWRRIRSLERFDNEYNDYRRNLKSNYESLRPIEYLKANFDELIPTLELNTFLNSLELSLKKIKKEISNKKNLSSNICAEIKALKIRLEEIDQDLAGLPTSTKDYTDEAQKFIFIGQLKAQLEFYQNKWNIEEELPDTILIENEIEELQKIIKDTNETRNLVISDLQDTIQKYFNLSTSMGVYKDYKVVLDIKDKSLKVRKPKEDHVQAIGSKSNYMFLHLFLFLGLHEHFLGLKHSYVPQFLILDQPSQPYYEGDRTQEEISNDDDKNKLQDAFKLLNDFITVINRDFESEFQMILLEHAPERYWIEKQLTNFHLVDKFRNGNALIPNRGILNNSPQ